METPKRRTTRPGLGAVGDSDSGLRPKHSVSTVPPVSGTRAHDRERVHAPYRDLDADLSAPLASDSVGASLVPPASQPPASQVPAATTTSPSITSRRIRSRNPVRVDEVGDVAVRLGAKHGRAIAAHAPRVLRERRELESAPIDHRDAFVLSLVDGRTSVQAIIDLAAMPSSEVIAILTRLAELGIVSLP